MDTKQYTQNGRKAKGKAVAIKSQRKQTARISGLLKQFASISSASVLNEKHKNWLLHHYIGLIALYCCSSELFEVLPTNSSRIYRENMQVNSS